MTRPSRPHVPSGSESEAVGYCDLCLHALTFTCRAVGLPCERRTPAQPARTQQPDLSGGAA